MNMLPNKIKDTVVIMIAILLVLFFVAWFSAPTQAQQVTGCADVKAGSAKLKKNYGETPVFRGVSAKGYLIVLFLNSQSGTWTVSRITPQNRTIMCPLDAGGDGSVRIGPDIKNDKEAEQKW
jgi:hypothetical protein